ncbi:MAG: DHHA1 domain-containing protein [Vampirovibrionales bacterium]|nr:DHHA1 domain-containing protein [Vampirovibrionales bacterium]
MHPSVAMNNAVAASVSPADLFGPATEALRQAKTLFVTVHVNPDGDALGSALAMVRLCEAAFPHLQQVDCVMDGEPAEYLCVIPDLPRVKNIHTDTTLLAEYDVALSCDSGSLERLGACADRYKAAKTTINLDHHVSNTLFADINLLMYDAAASGEVVAHWMEQLGVALTPESASAIYTTLVTDTGGFRFSSTTPYTHRLAAQCVEAGCDHTAIYKNIFEYRPKVQILLISEAVAAATFELDNQFAWTTVTQAQLGKYKALEEHTEGVVDALRQMREVSVAAFFKEMPDGTVKASLRSDKPSINVAEVLIPLGGGGHAAAAGCSFDMTLPEALALVLPKLRELL